MLKCDDLALVEELIKQISANSGKPSFAYGKGGANPDLTWLDSHGRPSNKVGIPFGLNNGKITEIWVGNELLVEYDIGIYFHYGAEVGLTLLKQVTIPATARTKTFDVADFGDILVPVDCQVAVRVLDPVGIPRNAGVHLTIVGTK